MSADRPSHRRRPLVGEPPQQPDARRRLFAAALAGWAAALAAGCQSQEQPWPYTVEGEAPLQKLPQVAGPVELRVAYVINERMPGITPELLDALLKRVQTLGASLLNLKLGFEPPKALSIKSVFDRIPAEARAALDAEALPFKTADLDSASRDALVAALAGRLRETRLPADELLAYAQPLLVRAPEAPSVLGLAEALVDTHWQRLQGLRAAKGLDTGPLLDGNPYNEPAYWAALDVTRLPFDVFVTNQVIAGVERRGGTLDGALRGGIVTGVTAPSGSARHGAYSVLSLYPVFSSEPWVMELRAGKSYAPAAAVDYAALLLLQQLGRQLLRLGTPFGQPGCVMGAPRGLDLETWAAAIAPSCALGSVAAMTPNFQPMPRPRYRAQLADPGAPGRQAQAASGDRPAKRKPFLLA
jgi:hypothetical protein